MVSCKNSSVHCHFSDTLWFFLQLPLGFLTAAYATTWVLDVDQLSLLSMIV